MPGRSPAPSSEPPAVSEVQTHCQRVRSAGSPKAPARSKLVQEYRKLAERLGIVPAEVTTGGDLQRASAGLLRAAAAAEEAAARDPLRRLRRPR
jgi:hypothetical protein